MSRMSLPNLQFFFVDDLEVFDEAFSRLDDDELRESLELLLLLREEAEDEDELE